MFGTQNSFCFELRTYEYGMRNKTQISSHASKKSYVFVKDTEHDVFLIFEFELSICEIGRTCVAESRILQMITMSKELFTG